jgi:glycosyltransferase involved in cell wall biosynthesis
MVEEIFSDTAVMFFESGNVSQFAECVIELYKNPALRQKLVANAYQVFIEKLSWLHEFQAYLDILHRLLPGTTDLHY